MFKKLLLSTLVGSLLAMATIIPAFAVWGDGCDDCDDDGVPYCWTEYFYDGNGYYEQYEVCID